MPLGGRLQRFLQPIAQERVAVDAMPMLRLELREDIVVDEVEGALLDVPGQNPAVATIVSAQILLVHQRGAEAQLSLPSKQGQSRIPGCLASFFIKALAEAVGLICVMTCSSLGAAWPRVGGGGFLAVGRLGGGLQSQQDRNPKTPRGDPHRSRGDRGFRAPGGRRPRGGIGQQRKFPFAGPCRKERHRTKRPAGIWR